MSKIKQNNINEEMPIFEAKCINNSSRCKLIYTGCAEVGKNVGDYPVEFNTPKEMIDVIGKNAYHVCEYKNYNVIAKIMNCSITGGYLSQFDNIPCYYMTLLYNSKFGTAGTVVTYGLNFIIDDKQILALAPKKKNISQEEQKTEIRQEEPKTEKKRTSEIDLKKLINNELYGTYSISITCDEEEKESFLKYISEKITTDSTIDYNKYLQLFKPIFLQSYQNKNIILYNKLLKILQNDIFMEFVYFILDYRFKVKADEVFHYFDEPLPKTIFNYNKLKENPELIDQMIDDEDRNSNKSDSDSE